MFRDVPECSGMFRDVPCSGFYRRPLSVYTRPSLTRSQHYESQLNCHTQIYFLHSLTSSNGLFRKQPVFLVLAMDQSIHSVHALHAAFLFLPLKDSHSPPAPGRPLKRGKF